jgi:hypothetical protein
MPPIKEETSEMGLGLPKAPVYRPSEEEFLNPLEYIAKIRPEAEQFGICKIVPPESWKPPFRIDTNDFEFNTRIQIVSELQNKVSSSPEYKTWNNKYLAFLKTLGKDKKRNPTFSGREIELFKFHTLAQKRGGYQACCDQKAWRDIARLLGVRPSLFLPRWSSFIDTLTDYLTKTGRHVSFMTSCLENLQVTGGGSNLSYGIRALYTKHFARFDAWIANDCMPVDPDDKHAVKSEAGMENGMEVDAEVEEAAAILESLMGTTDQVPEKAATTLKKRKASSEKGDAAGKVRTIARRLRGHPCVSPAPSHPWCDCLQKKRAKGKKSTDKPDAKRIPANIDTLLCEICSAGHHEDKIILCDRCDKGFHLFCLSPPLDDVPVGDWVCPHCSQQDNDNIFFRSGCKMTFKEMREWNESFAQGWFGDEYTGVRCRACNLFARILRFKFHDLYWRGTCCFINRVRS